MQVIKQIDYAFGGYYDSHIIDDAQGLIGYLECGNPAIDLFSEPLVLKIADLYSDDVIYEEEVFRWNYQLGVRFTWSSSGDNYYFLRSRYGLDGELKGVIRNINTNLDSEVPPFSSISTDFTKGVTLDLGIQYSEMWGYSFGYIRSEQDHRDCLKIWNVTTGSILKTINISEIGSGFDDQVMSHFDHPVFNPGGNKLAFLVRSRNTIANRFTDIYVYCLITESLTRVSKTGRTSHFAWLDDDTVLVFGSNTSVLSEARRKHGALINNIGIEAGYKFLRKRFKRFGKRVLNDCFYTANVSNRSDEEVPYMAGKWKSLGAVTDDGHPCYVGLSDMILFDEYPNEDYRYRLFKSTSDSNTPAVIDTYIHDKRYINSEKRCDLHPKTSNRGKHCAVDTLIDDKRSIIIYGA